MRRFRFLPLLAAVAGCAAQSSYMAPAQPTAPRQAALTVHQPRDVVWDRIVPALQGNFFIISHMDRASGVIAITYAGDPSRYVDCGQVTVEDPVSGMTTFPAAARHASYRVYAFGEGFHTVVREMNLDARMNIVLAETPALQTQVSMIAHYVLTRTVSKHASSGEIRDTASIAMNTGEAAVLGADGGVNRPITCQPTGSFEQEVADLFRGISS